MLPSGEPDRLIGPFKAIYDEDRQKKGRDTIYYALVGEPDEDHLYTGLQYEDGVEANTIVLEEDDVTRTYVRIIGKGIESTVFDLVSDEQLLSDFRKAIYRSSQGSRQISREDIAELLEAYRKGNRTARNLQDKVTKVRMERLQAILEASVNPDRSAELLSDFIGPLLTRFPEREIYQSILETLSQDDEFLERTSMLEPFQKITDGLERDIDTLQAQKEELSLQVEELRRLDPKAKIEACKKQVEELEVFKRNAQDELDRILEKTHLSENLERLLEKKEYLEEQIEARKLEAMRQEERLESLSTQFDQMLANSSQRALEMSFDNLIGERFMAQAADLERHQARARYEQTARALATMERSWLDDEQAISVLTGKIRAARPNYTQNEVLNMLICLSQSAFTLFTGRPGSGKTSAVRLMASALGLNRPVQLEKERADQPEYSRFVSISVEKGWSSRRDLIGGYNPLSRTFDPSSQSLYDLLNIMDAEVRLHQQSALPGVVLLDDANLSNMEYYLADFMALDEREVRGQLNPGTGELLNIPRSLHFACTIQNDHTSEPLSARMLDRCWVIDMPNHPRVALEQGFAMDEREELFSQSRLEQLFGAPDEDPDFDEPMEEEVRSMFDAFEQFGLSVSFRSRQAIRTYLQAARRWFVEEDPEQPAIREAFDFAISQRILPQVSGSGDEYRGRLENLQHLLEENGLFRSASKLKDIMERGDHSMQYYQYF